MSVFDSEKFLCQRPEKNVPGSMLAILRAEGPGGLDPGPPQAVVSSSSSALCVNRIISVISDWP